ncbi:aspartyl protease family protein-like [Iris pallida]|uniref:Aspartyl protease family protein-like n=1 Tax=Iris pallida TaxID=29817 RepID=A0AAX6F4L4_IRIPA|nr:aspartyl protease family protein-like [Iris pallida]
MLAEQAEPNPRPDLRPRPSPRRLDPQPDHVQARPRKYSSPSSKLSATTTTQIPATKGDSFGSGGAYVVTVGFGTPLQQTLVFDTGSVVTWVQCQPCAASCYRQQQPIFDPARSSTYRNISCASPYCSPPELSASTCGASGDTCVYGVQYGDGSFTQGYYGTDTLALTPADTIQSFRFGCGQYQGGTFGQVAGLMGLGRAPSSVVSQADSKYGGVFSYCLPPTSSSAGRLAFGSGSLPSDVQYTPMLSPSSGGGGGQPFYFLELVSISVGGKKLAISAAVFSNAGTIIDSGTTVTYLPPAAYSALRRQFRKRMSRYRSAAGEGPLDTCYDFGRASSVTLPAVALEFRGASMGLAANGIVFPVSSTKACLAFAANGNDSDVGILGNVQQRTFDVVYDVPNLKIGFGAQGC